MDSLSAAVPDGRKAQRDLTALRDVHLRINDTIVREGRAAYSALGMAYPGSEEGDAAIRAFYEREWPVTIPV